MHIGSFDSGSPKMMAWSYVACTTAAVIVTSVELAFRNQRHPFGDKNFKAVGWWLAVSIIDAAVGLLMLAGVVGVEILDPSAVSGTNKVLQGIVVGALGPLALRSPVRRTQIHDQEAQAVGITYFYDLARLRAIYALDERFVCLKRRDVVIIKDAWRCQGLDSRLVAASLHRHLNDHPHLADDQRDRIFAAAANSLTLPGEDQCMTALIKLIRQERFSSLVDELNSYEPGSIQLEELAVFESISDEEDLEIVEDEISSS